MINNKEVKNEKLLPDTEVVNQKLAILKRMNEALKAHHYDEANAQSTLNAKLNEKYDFFDQVFEENGKKGLKDMTGKVLVPALYADYAETYHYELFRGQPVGAFDEHHKCGLVATDGKGTPITPFEYDDAHISDISHYIMVLKGEKKGLIKRDGTVVVPCILDTLYLPFNGISSIVADDKFGLITSWGLYVEPIYDEMDEKDDMPYVRKGDIWGFLDDEGHFVAENDSDIDDITLINYFMALP